MAFNASDARRLNDGFQAAQEQRRWEAREEWEKGWDWAREIQLEIREAAQKGEHTVELKMLLTPTQVEVLLENGFQVLGDGEVISWEVNYDKEL